MTGFNEATLKKVQKDPSDEYDITYDNIYFTM